MNSKDRIKREKQTVAAMINLSCNRRHHSTKGELCQECNDLLNYTYKRLDRCQFGEDKPVCANCQVHCYKSDMKESIREVMRYSGPKMLWMHPILAIRHFMDQHSR